MKGFVYTVRADPILAIPSDPHKVAELLRSMNVNGVRVLKNNRIYAPEKLTFNETLQIFNCGYYLERPDKSRKPAG